MLNTLLPILVLLACGSEDNTPLEGNATFADVTKVEVYGREGSYRFAVTLLSPDTGCDQYADWWEVLSEDGQLIQRRILLHSHIDEQPFTRSGSNIDITATKEVYIRAHMNNLGYGGLVMKGTVKDGFELAEVNKDFAADVESQEPLPKRCAF
ncbi:MAG: hypothetical protein AAGF85_13140 [Bacteroidota bacterium]